jgi:hypothetical protein
MAFDDFIEPTLPARWTPTCIGNGLLSFSYSSLRLEMMAAQQGHYTDAQIDDYAGHARSQFPWHAPLRMEVCARFSHEAAGTTTQVTDSNYLRGTAGFGFWNYPFSVRGDILMPPEAIWFFYASPPSNMALVPGIIGWGWKAQVVHSMRAGALAAVLPTAFTIGWASITGHSQPAARWLQRLSGASETLLSADMLHWHTYTLEWQQQQARFWVDGHPVLSVPNPPVRSLGFVAWLDNQYAIATPRGVLRFGTVASGPQWLELDSIRIEPL